MDDNYGIAMIVDKVVIIASKAHVQKQPLSAETHSASPERSTFTTGFINHNDESQL
jgi:hypothetical protein